MLVKRLDECRPDPKQPRKVFAQNELQRLADNMREVGQLQPILITPDGLIVAGQRRWLAARLAGMTSINAIVVDATEAMVRVSQLAENLAREALTPLEVVDGVREAALLHPGVAGAKLAEMVGLKPTELSKVNAINGCPVAYAALSNGDLGSVGEAYAVALAAPEEKQGLINLKLSGAPSSAITKSRKPRASDGVKADRTTIQMPGGVKVQVSGPELDLDGLIDALSATLDAAKRAKKDYLNIKTFAKVSADKARAS